MTANPNLPVTPLGVGTLVSESFSLFFSRIVTMFKIIFIPMLVLGAIDALLSGPILMASIGVFTGDFDPELVAKLENQGIFAKYILPLIATVVSFILSGVVLLAAYDTTLNRRIDIPAYVNRTLAYFFPIVVLSILLTIISYVGMIFFIIPGLYLAARFSVLVPAIIIDGAGWGGMGRAQALTAGYRWPIVGALILFSLAIIVIALVFLGLTYLAYSIAGIVGYALLQVIGSTLLTGLMGCFTALLFARLKEIKEGVGMSDIATVFE